MTIIVWRIEECKTAFGEGIRIFGLGTRCGPVSRTAKTNRLIITKILETIFLLEVHIRKRNFEAKILVTIPNPNPTLSILLATTKQNSNNNNKNDVLG